jgi:hypothetical protein
MSGFDMPDADTYRVANVNIELVKVHSEVNSILPNGQHVMESINNIKHTSTLSSSSINLRYYRLSRSWRGRMVTAHTLDALWLMWPFGLRF